MSGGDGKKNPSRTLRERLAAARAALTAKAYRVPDAVGAVPVYRSKLPTAERLFPYLKKIDASRWYTNRGELVCELERRLSLRFGGRSDIVVTAASGTSAIEGAILAGPGRATAERPLALVPAYTFVATAFAVERCGYTPYLVDIEPDNWMLGPERLSDHPLLPQTGLVVPVSAYGRPLRQKAWQDFQDRTGVPVVIDAAAAFEAVIADPNGMIGRIPIALSFQATKSFSSGEGGAVVWSDVEGLSRVVSSLNFGFRRSRASEASGSNGKMSEYHAAVGLAALDEWEAKAAANRAVAAAYRRATVARGMADCVIAAPDIASNYALLAADSLGEASEVIGELAANRIEHRLWYGLGLHRQPYLASAAADPLPVADDLAPRLVALPCFEDLAAETIDRIAACLARVLISQPTAAPPSRA
jgi:dTDP-4-amino-4,6-dideoxygalactose transaminase